MSRRSGDNEWYADGLRFECTCCGACCTGPPGFVLFTDEEATAMAARLGISVPEFLERYTHETAEGRSLQERLTHEGYDCVFLDRESVPDKAVCTLYEARPLQCRTFPWWPENLEHPRHWQRLARTCEGVGRGPLIPVEAIRIQRNAQTNGRPIPGDGA